MLIWRCKKCGWIGRDSDLGLHYGNDEEYCPRCKEVDSIATVDFSDRFNSQEVEKLWQFFGEIPIDDEDAILEEFLGFSEGTDRIEIWHWFDERHSKGVAFLLYGEEAVSCSTMAAYYESLCQDCETTGCAYNDACQCRFPLVHHRVPIITDEDGCLEMASQI